VRILFGIRTLTLTVALLGCTGLPGRLGVRAETMKYQSHPPLRTAPPPSKRAVAKGPARFVNARGGDDQGEGTKASPWKTIQHALQFLEAGDTLYLRGGVYYENVRIALAGRKDAPITLRSYRGETAIIDGGFREFFESPSEAWTPFAGGAEGEFVSTRAYRNIRNVMGSFGDSMVGLNTYFHAIDLRAKSEIWHWKDWDKRGETDAEPLYCGPGLWYDRSTGHIHARLAHTNLPEIDNYRGETNPRSMPLIIAPHGSVPLTINGAHHLRLQDLVIRGGGYDSVVIDYGVDIEFDNVTVWCGTYGMRTCRTGPLRFYRSALYGNIPPWLFRSDSSKRAYPGRPHRDVTRLNTHSNWVIEGGREFSVFATPMNDNWEIAYSEITDAADGPYFGGVNLRFHHNLVENMQDDGLYLSQMYPRHIYMRGGAEIHLYENVFRRCLTVFAFGGMEPGTKDKVYIYRNIVDLRAPVLTGRPSSKNPVPGKSPGKMAGDHGSPPWPEMRIYHNTFLLNGHTMGFGGHTHPDRPRHVFNNIFVHYGRWPALQVPKLGHGQADGNLYWFPSGEPKQAELFFKRYRAAGDYAKSKEVYAPGFTANSLAVDPRLVEWSEDPLVAGDCRLQNDSPAIDAGVVIPDDWSDPLRDQDRGRPDLGALEHGASMFRYGRQSE